MDRVKRLATWWGVLLVATVFLANEVLLWVPALSMLYPLIRVAILPVLCILQAGSAVVEAVRNRRLLAASPSIVSLAVLSFQWFYPWALFAHP